MTGCRQTRRPRAIAAVLIVALAALGCAPAALASTATWTGASASAGWATTTNWNPAAAPVNNQALSFPSLPSCPASSACYASEDTVGSRTASSVTVADDLPYVISSGGGTLSLAPGSGNVGLVAYPTTAAAGTTEAYFSIPLVIADPQRWTITGNGVGAGALTVASSLSGDALAVTLGSGGRLELIGTVNLGNLSVSGAAPGAGAANGELALSGAVNASTQDGSIQADDIAVAIGGYNGALTQTAGLTLQDTALTLGADGPNGPGTIHVSGGVTLDANSTTTIETEGPGQAAGTDYAQLSATGNVQLGGPVTIADEGAATATCPPAGTGGVDTFISTSGGTLSGQFTNLPNGAIVELPVHCGGTTQNYPIEIQYTRTAVTGTFVVPVVTSTALSVAPTSITVGYPVSFTATVTPAALGDGPPTGAVQFLFDGTDPVYCTHAGDGVLGGGGSPDDVATCTAPAPLVGSFAMTAVYEGDGQYAASTSPGVGLQINQAPFTPIHTPGGGASGVVSSPGPRAGSGRIRVSALHVRGRTVHLRLSCARGGASCAVRLRLVTEVAVRHGRRIVRRTIVIGLRRAKLAAGSHRVESVRLNAAGGRLLAHHQRLRARLLVQRKVGHRTHTLAARRVKLPVTHRH